MFVRLHYKGHAVTSLHVGRENANRYFARSNRTIELELDHLRIQCGLPAGFWAGEAEIRDQRLCAWLQSKYQRGRAAHSSVVLSMVPSGLNSFTLGPAAVQEGTAAARPPRAMAAPSGK